MAQTIKKKRLIVIAGPTAIGKTTVAIKLAQHFDCPILSTDSRQIYKEMNIGTAKPSKNELAAATHYFINHISIEEDYNAGKYEREAIAKLDDIYKNHDTAIISGGTGFYINAILHGLDSFPITSKEDEKYYESLDLSALQEELKLKDPKYYDVVDIKNRRRLERALSVIKASGKTFSSQRKAKKKNRIFTPILILLEMDREKLYSRINKRVDMMIEQGLVEEAKSLYNLKGLRALDTVGYQEIFQYFDGEITLEKAIELIKRNSRRYAKRQMTWYRNKPEWDRFKPQEIEKIIQNIQA